MPGTIRFKDNWDFAFSEYSGPRDEEIDKLLSAPALTDDFSDWWENRKKPTKQNEKSIVDNFHLQITCKYPQDDNPKVAKRRFVYCWRKLQKDDEWENIGLLMTDDDGLLFNLSEFCSNPQNNSISKPAWNFEKMAIWKYDFKKHKWNWGAKDFFGGTEDSLAFALAPVYSPPVIEPEYVPDPDFFIYENGKGMVFRDPFIVQEKYLTAFSRDSEYFLMFCPPDIIDHGLYSKKEESSAKQKNFKFWPQPRFYWIKRELQDNSEFGLHLDANDKLIMVDKSSLLRYKKSSPAPNQDKPGTIVAKELPVTLEEHLSNFAFHTCLLDMLYADVIESAKLLYLQDKTKEIACLLKLMANSTGECTNKLDSFPIVESRSDGHSTARAEEPDLKADGTETLIRKLKDDYYRKKDVLAAAEGMENFIKKDYYPTLIQLESPFFNEISIVEGIVSSKALLERTKDWVQYTEFSSPLDYPFSMKFYPAESDCSIPYGKVPILYHIVELAFSTILSIGFKKNGSQKTVAEEFHESSIISFEGKLEKKFKDADINNELTNHILNPTRPTAIVLPKPTPMVPQKDSTTSAAENGRVVKESNQGATETSSSEPSPYPMLYEEKNNEEDERTLLEVIFSDVVMEKIVPHKWPNQKKIIDSHLQTIIKLSNGPRTRRILEKNNSEQTMAHIRIYLGAVLLVGLKAENEIKKMIDTGISEWGKCKESGKMPENISDFCLIVGASFTLRDILAKHEELSKDRFNENKDFVHRRIFFTEIITWVIESKIPIFKAISNVIIEPISIAMNVVAANRARSETIFCLNTRQLYEAGFRAIEAASDYMSGVLAIVDATPLSLFFAKISFGIEDHLKERKIQRCGIENYIKEIRDNLSKIDLLRPGTDTLKLSKFNWLLLSLTPVALPTMFDQPNPYYSERDGRYSSIQEEYNKLSGKLENISYWNLDIDKAGPELKNMGYNVEFVRLLCGEPEDAMSGPQPASKPIPTGHATATPKPTIDSASTVKPDSTATPTRDSNVVAATASTPTTTATITPAMNPPSSSPSPTPTPTAGSNVAAELAPNPTH